MSGIVKSFQINNESSIKRDKNGSSNPACAGADESQSTQSVYCNRIYFAVFV